MEFVIKPPEGCSVENIKKEITMENDTIKVVMTYPNGFTLTSIIKGENQTVIPSGKLIDLGDGVYQIPN